MFKPKKRILKLTAETLRVLSGEQTRRALGGVCSGRSEDWGKCTSDNNCTVGCGTQQVPSCVTCLTCQCSGRFPFTTAC